ncbi:phosphotransferase enzyme family protein [Kribbella alba]|uniref:Phosphotransferase enzyme family protein n=1 Tax=Kribbella alba TaxID=190197 RepID=A0ABN2F7S4_9ACTN
MIPTLRSLPDPQALAAQVKRAYALQVTEIHLLRSLVNDVYEVGTEGGRYVLKLYRSAGWTPSEVHWEGDLSAHLDRSGLVVPQVQPLADGSPVGLLDAAEGTRPFILSSFVVGTRPQPPFDDELYRSFGQLVAGFHDAADTFTSSHQRRPSDLRRRLDEPLALILPLLPEDERELLSALANAVRDQIELYAGQLSWGVCHGDVTLDNVLLTDRGLALHDFDLSAEGWRAADFVGVAATPHWDAFAAGYAAKRALTDVDTAAIPWLMVAASIFNLRFHLHDKPLIRGRESIGEGWAANELASLRKAARELL